jgi:hypothetical protein
MNRNEYISWMQSAPLAEREALLTAVGLPGRIGGQAIRGHWPGGYPVWLVMLQDAGPGALGRERAAMRLMPVGGKWAPFIMVSSGGCSEMKFKHECGHITQFFGDPIRRAYFIEAQAEPPPDPQAIADYLARQFTGCALAEFEVYRDVNRLPAEVMEFGAAYFALNDAIRVIRPTIAEGFQFAGHRFLDVATPALLRAASTVAASPYFLGHNVEGLVEDSLTQIQKGRPVMMSCN